MPDIAKHPPCSPKCPMRSAACHAECDEYKAWRAQMDAVHAERRKLIDADQGIYGMMTDRSEYLRRRGYKTKSNRR